MTEVAHRPGVTVVNGVEHPDALWRCLCGAAVRYRAFRTPPGWCEMSISVGGENGIPQEQTKIMCPPCTRSMLMGIPPMRAPQLNPQTQQLALPANVPWTPPWRK